MSNGARRRFISRLRPRKFKRTHKRVLDERYWAMQRMHAAVIDELDDEDVRIQEPAPRVVWGYGTGPKARREAKFTIVDAPDPEPEPETKQRRLPRFLRRKEGK